MTTRMLAEYYLGSEAVRAAERWKSFTTYLGHELQAGFSAAVDGESSHSAGVDVTTEKGAFEFCASQNTKNGAGAAHDATRGTRVQATGKPRLGWISGEAFLEMHDVDPRLANAIRWSAGQRAWNAVRCEQLELPDTEATSDAATPIPLRKLSWPVGSEFHYGDAPGTPSDRAQ